MSFDIKDTFILQKSYMISVQWVVLIFGTDPCVGVRSWYQPPGLFAWNSGWTLSDSRRQQQRDQANVRLEFPSPGVVSLPLFACSYFVFLIVRCEVVLGEFLKEIKKNPSSVKFAEMANILVIHCQVSDESKSSKSNIVVSGQTVNLRSIIKCFFPRVFQRMISSSWRLWHGWGNLSSLQGEWFCLILQEYWQQCCRAFLMMTAKRVFTL